MSNKFCIFVSAGDRHAIASWLAGAGARSWDLVIVYYGDDDEMFAKLSAVATHAFRQKGGKFQNLRHGMAVAPRLFDPYDYIWVCDDDMLIRPGQIEIMFSLAQQFEFWVCQPALAPGSKISFEITAMQDKSPIRIVNFVETAFPLFRRDKLMEFMAHYDGSLTGYGIDWWFCNVLNARWNARFAIIDAVQVINPHHQHKSGGDREIDRLQPLPERRAAWENLRDRTGMQEYSVHNLWMCFLVR
jgi:hypothetical protein